MQLRELDANTEHSRKYTTHPHEDFSSLGIKLCTPLPVGLPKGLHSHIDHPQTYTTQHQQGYSSLGVKYNATLHVGLSEICTAILSAHRHTHHTLKRTAHLSMGLLGRGGWLETWTKTIRSTGLTTSRQSSSSPQSNRVFACI